MKAEILTSKNGIVLKGSMKNVTKLLTFLKIVHGEKALIVDIMEYHANKASRTSKLD